MKMRAYLTSIIIHIALFAVLVFFVSQDSGPIDSPPFELSLFEKALQATPKAPSTPKTNPSFPKQKEPNPSASNTNAGVNAPQNNSNQSAESGEALVEEYEAAEMPVLLNEVKIPYPIYAKTRRIQGPVVFDLIISSSGTVKEAIPVSSPDPELTQAALAAVLQFKFKPARYGDKSVAIKIRYTYRFVLQ